MPEFIACIDGSPATAAVCDAAAWAVASQPEPAVTLLHVLDHTHYPVVSDFSGSIGLGSREHLLVALAELDEQRSKLALEQGEALLADAKTRLQARGINATARQRHGDLLECILELSETMSLLIMGRHGDLSAHQHRHIGSHVENVIRALHRPILIAPDDFAPPKTGVLLAYDGSASSRQAVQFLMHNPLFAGLPVHLLMIGADTLDAQAQLQWAQTQLLKAGIDTSVAIRPGDVSRGILAYQADHGLDAVVMGAYGHSRLRQFFVGSTTTALLRHCQSPLLLLR
ncbi:nucleotide-binding universal stress UspA family protein [Paraperlucidibaca baekdonensis]|uniref:Nucleotide-binding universal stress UspA family protein n=1 Tax=Paraperlucidibaca baekdonensis TaxID=748120 RepID=A0A3E0H4C6_9GAMM|nr:universal stress protein [Paraperlucidibaca baekdonensis]REH37693.1 nucleotide-binding universal stress UspA family protein [Paraperlucidibaca baekdonensis]